jgi:hypothetical protein
MTGDMVTPRHFIVNFSSPTGNRLPPIMSCPKTISLLRSRTTSKGTETLIEAILTAQKSGKIDIERITEERWRAAWKLSNKFADKPDISFVGFV